MPQRAERQFPAEFVRQGGIVTKALVTIRCSRCPVTKVHESTTLMPDQVISKRLKSWGWVLGRNRAYDICPRCAGVTSENKLAARFRVISDGQEVPSPSEVADAVGQERAIKSKQVAALIEKTFGPVSNPVPEAPPSSGVAEVSPVAVPRTHQEPVEKIEKAVSAMADDLGQIRAAMELMMEQFGALADLQKQHIQAVANQSVIIARLNEGMAAGFTMMSVALRELAEKSSTITNVSEIAQPEKDIDIPALPIRSGFVRKRLDTKKPRRGSDTRPASVTSPQKVSINSYPDGKNPSKFYTMVHLPKSVWTDCGFRNDDRVLIDRHDGETIRIRRASEGGVKLKKVTDAVVVIQTTRVGNLNFEVRKPIGSKGEIRLHA